MALHGGVAWQHCYLCRLARLEQRRQQGQRRIVNRIHRLIHLASDRFRQATTMVSVISRIPYSAIADVQ